MREFNIKENVTIKIDLYKNRRELLGEIPLEWVEKITYKFDDIDEINLTVPKFITVNGEKKFNALYLKINTRQSLIVTTKNKNGMAKQQRFTLGNKKVAGNKVSAKVSYNAYSWEKTIERDKISVDMMARQLTNKDDNVNIGEGILDAICKRIGWTVGYVDQDARVKTYKDVETFSQSLYTNLNVTNVTEGKLLFNKNINITVSQNKPLYCTFYHNEARVYDSNNTIMTVNIQNTITDALYDSIKNIKAYQYSEAGNRFGIKYVFTTTSNVEIIRISNFTNCINKNIEIKDISLSYDFADVVEMSRVQYANFEAFDDNAYKYLQDIQDVFNCHFEYDTMNKVINVYSRENLTNKAEYILTLGENVKDISTTEEELIPTVLKVDSELTSIVEENPNGTTYIENYDYYIKNNLISDTLTIALEKYNIQSMKLMEEFNTLNKEKLQWTQKNIKTTSEIKSLTERIGNLRNLLTAYIADANAQNQARVKAEMTELENRQKQLVLLSRTYTTEIERVNKEIEINNSKVRKENIVDGQGRKIFSKDDLLEIADMREVTQLTDSYYTTPYSLFNYATEYLNDLANPKVTFDLDCINLVNAIKNPKGWNNILKLGYLFKLEKNDLLNENEIRLIEMELKPIENKVSINAFKFSNKMNDISKTKGMGAKIGRTTNKINGKMTNFSQLWEDSKYTNNFVEKMMNEGLDIASMNIRGGVFRNKFSMTEAGEFIIDAINEDNQLYLGAGILAITDSGWKTCKTAIDKNGIIAETIIGHLILSEKLIVQDEGGTFYIGNGDNFETDKEFGLSVYDDLQSGRQRRIFLGLSMENGVRRAKLRLTDKSGRNVVISEEGLVQTHQFVCWDNLTYGSSMRIPYVCDEGVFTNKRIILSMIFEKYRAFERGMSSGGMAQTSSSGGGGTSASGGGGTSASGGTTSTQINSNDSFTDTTLAKPMENRTGINGNYGTVEDHSHFFTIQPRNHTHEISGHTHGILSHTHEIYNHIHTLDTSHNHTLDYGIFEQNSMCSNVSIFINGVRRFSDINTDCDVDITNFIEINKTNRIEIQTDTNGRLTCNVFTKAFVGF